MIVPIAKIPEATRGWIRSMDFKTSRLSEVTAAETAEAIFGLVAARTASLAQAAGTATRAPATGATPRRVRLARSPLGPAPAGT